jgi:hypothetical protein
MSFTRRNVLMSTLFGAGYVGLRALATGVPAAALLKGREAFADGATCVDKTKAQYIIMSTSGSGDPINANAPGTYLDSGIVHPDPVANPQMKPAMMSIGGQNYTAALPWTQLDPTIVQRMSFFHIMTNTPVHPKQPDVQKLLGATNANEMLPSLLAKQLAPCLGTVQTQPISLGATTPSEGLSFSAQPLPIIPPLALKATLTSPTGPLMNLQAIRDQTLAQLDSLYRGGASPAQKKYLDSLVNSQSQVRNIRQDLLSSLSNITDNGVQSQITAAMALIQMNVTPVIAIHIPCGGDNHSDPGLQNEVAQTVTFVQSIGQLISAIPTSLKDSVTFMSLNVFGRTLGAGSLTGRNHNQNHQLSVTVGAPFKSKVIGGVAPVGNDYGAVAIDSSNGKGGAGGDISPPESLASFGKTMLAAVGVDQATIDQNIVSGKVITAALNS